MSFLHALVLTIVAGGGLLTCAAAVVLLLVAEVFDPPEWERDQ